VRVVLEFGVGYDPNVALDLLFFTTECPPSSPTPIPTWMAMTPTP